MLFLVACLLGQFVPGEASAPTLDDFKVICRELKQQQLADERSALEQMKPTAKQFVQPSRSEKQQLLKDIKDKETELKKIEKDQALLPVPQVLVQSLEIGQIGELFTRVVYTENVPSPSGKTGETTSIERIETRPATLTVLKSYRPNAIVCVCDKTELVLLHHKGPPPANGEIIQTPGIYRISGFYKVAGKSLPAVESWEHNTEWQKKIKRPAPAGRIQIVTKPSEPQPAPPPAP